MTDKKLLKLTKLIESKLSYLHFFEADKSRFIKPLFDTYKDLSPYSLDEILDFYKKHNEVKVDWTQKDKENLFLELINIMNDNQKKIEQRDEEKKYYRQSDANELLSSHPELTLIPELETDEWVFACPKSWEGAKFTDSAECGGTGAKWCIGYENSDKYWEKYVNDKWDSFVLALRKDFKTYHDKDHIKYMIEINRHEFNVWEQEDNDVITSNTEKFFNLFHIDFEQVKSIAVPIFNKGLNLKKNFKIEGTTLIIDDLEGFIDRAVENPENIETIILSNGIDGTKFRGMADYPNLKRVILPDSLKEIDTFLSYYFNVPLYNSQRLFCFPKKYKGSYVIPDGIQFINDGAFNRCKGLTSITIPDSVIRIGREAFMDCKNLKTVDFGYGVRVIEKSAFKNCESVENITLPDSVATLGSNVFSGCSNLESIKLPESLQFINDSAFSECSKLKNIDIGEEVKTIDSFAFAYCENLNSFTIPKSVNYVARHAFYCCNNLEEVTFEGLPKNVYKPFTNDDNLKSIFVHKEYLEDFYNMATEINCSKDIIKSMNY